MFKKEHSVEKRKITHRGQHIENRKAIMVPEISIKKYTFSYDTVFEINF